MRNLAGNKDCDSFIVAELREAGIEIVQGERSTNEVPASVTGRLNGLTFTRGWYYWRVAGKVPIDIARELYQNPIGKTDVRVAGHCGCPPPDEWVNWYWADGREVLTTKTKLEFERLVQQKLMSERESSLIMFSTTIPLRSVRKAT